SVGNWGSSTSGTASSTCVSNTAASYWNGNQGFSFKPNIASPSVSPSPTASNICPATTVTLNASDPVFPAGSTYQWYKNGVSIPSATSSSYTASASGNYIV